MKIALAQLNYHIGHFSSNEEKIINAIAQAKAQQVDIIVFAELAISGYPPRDFLEFDDFIDKCYAATESIAKHCQDIGAIVGLPTRNTTGKGKPLHNSAAFLSQGKIQEIKHKSLLPNYDIFDEYRYFEPNQSFSCLNYKGQKIALTICEDLWNIGHDPLYKINPMDELIKEQPDFMINIAASPFHHDQMSVRKDILRQNVKKYQIPLFYLNHVGAQTEFPPFTSKNKRKRSAR